MSVILEGFDERLASGYREATPNAAAFAERARRTIPGGASRDAIGRQPYPPVVTRASGQHVYDIDGRRYIDYCLNLGPVLIGHAFEPIARAVRDQMEVGCGFGTPSELEAELAERVRFLSTGSEAIMYLVRVARAFTGRSRIVKFIGAYHGSHDSAQLSVRPTGRDHVGKGWHGLPQTEGLSPLAPTETLAIPYNDLGALRDCLEAYAGEIALVLVDPCMNACGLAAPAPGFLERACELTRAAGALLGFDEVVSGFRYGLGGASELYGIRPDVVAFGKALGGGLPIGAVGGRADVMAVLEATTTGGPRVGQSGTFAGNPLTMAAGVAFLDHVSAHPEGYVQAAATTERIRTGLRDVARRHSVPTAVTGTSSMFQIHAGVEDIVDYETFARRDPDFRRRLFLYLAQRGVLAPPATATFFVSWSHSEADADVLLDAIDDFFSSLYHPGAES
jgi:glutamate-1-semialdehyde 2,1-aminomutase